MTRRKTHNTTETRELLAQIGTPQNEGMLDYDLITQIRVPDVQRLVNLKNDPFFKEKVLADNGSFTDPKRVLYAISSALRSQYHGMNLLTWL